MRRRWLAVLGSVALIAAPALAQQQINLRDADIRAFIQDAARATGRTFVIDSRVQGKVSVVTDRPLSRSEYFEVFLSTLRANGLVAIPTGTGAFRIQPAETAAAQPGRIGLKGAARNAFVTEVFRLKSVDATTAVETLRPLVSKEGSVTANRSGNSLVVADYADNVRRIRALIARIDGESATTTIVALRNAGAKEVAASLQQLLTGGQTAGQNGRTAVALSAVESSNAIALRGDRQAVARFAELARDLDRRAASGSEVKVYWLKNADAEKLVPVLQTLSGQSVAAAATTATGVAPIPAAAPDPSGNSRNRIVITRYDGANAVIIAAPSEVQRSLSDVIRQLDSRRPQILVEAIIVEISDNAAKKLGVQFLLGGTPGSNIPFAATNYSTAAPNILTVAGAIGARELNTTTTTVNGTTTVTTTNTGVSDALAQSAISSILSASGGFGGFATNIGNNGVFGAIINAVKQDNQSNILSTPSITTIDNQSAKILVGQEIPVTTGEALSDNFDNRFRTVQRQNVGIQLEVKPQVNENGEIKLALRQEVSSIAGPVSATSSELILNKREFETTIVVKDGEIAAVGGLLDDNERRTLEKVPGLGDMPGLGGLFRSKGKTRTKTNLMVFIRPTILRTSEEMREISARRFESVRGAQADFDVNGEPGLDALVRDYLGAVPPSATPAQVGDVIIEGGPAAAPDPAP
ncbi:MAG: type II secretion system secretin GspD [Sphingomonadales bacterium]|nr:type II secretion system secretin GspD [Sphingomonadales bacterium]